MLVKVAIHCHNCGGQVDPLGSTPVGPYVRYCENCTKAHEQAWALLAQNQPPSECARCHKSWETLKQEASGAEVQMTLILLNGLYLMLCAGCDRYFQQRSKHRYKDTPYGKTMNLF